MILDGKNFASCIFLIWVQIKFQYKCNHSNDTNIILDNLLMTQTALYSCLNLFLAFRTRNCTLQIIWRQALCPARQTQSYKLEAWVFQFVPVLFKEDNIIKETAIDCCCWLKGDCLTLPCSGTARSCVVAGWLHSELQWTEGGEWTINQPQTAVSGRNARLLRNKSVFCFCWQV